MDWGKTTARWDEKHLSFGIWCLILEVWRLSGPFVSRPGVTRYRIQNDSDRGRTYVRFTVTQNSPYIAPSRASCIVVIEGFLDITHVCNTNLVTLNRSVIVAIIGLENMSLYYPMKRKCRYIEENVVKMTTFSIRYWTSKEVEFQTHFKYFLTRNVFSNEVSSHTRSSLARSLC